MKPTPGDIAAHIQELSSRSLRQHVRNSQRFADLLKRVSGGEVSLQEVRDELRQFSEQEVAEYLRTITTMGINFFSGLLELNQSLNDRFFQRLEQGHRGAEEPVPKSRGQLVLRGNPGETARGRFIVENRRQQESDVAMMISPVSGPDGVSFQAPFVIDPSSLRLGAGEEHAVQLSLRLHPELFKAGEQYSCQLAVHGSEDMLLDVLIEIAEMPEATVAVGEAVTVAVEEEFPVWEAKPPTAPAARGKNSLGRTVRGKRTVTKATAKKSSPARKRGPKKHPSA